MSWLVRFSLGLPARPTDVAEIREQAPELLEEGRDVRVMPVVMLVHPRTFEEDRAAFASAVRKWVGEVTAPERRAPSCELLGGDPAARFERFLAVVARVHENAGPARRVVVSDPRLLAEAFDGVSSPGFDRLCRYLATLGLGDDLAILLPSEKAPAESRSRFTEMLRTRFAPTRVALASPAHRFASCVYLVEHEGGEIRGVIGPPMARAGDGEIAPIGELALPDAAALFADWLLASPPTRAATKKKTRG